MNLKIKLKPAITLTVIFKLQCIQKVGSAKWLSALPTDTAVAVLTLEKTRPVAAELDDRRSSFSAVLIRCGDTLHLQFDIDVHHITGVISQKTKPFFALHRHQQWQGQTVIDPIIQRETTRLGKAWKCRTGLENATNGDETLVSETVRTFVWTDKP